MRFDLDVGRSYDRPPFVNLSCMVGGHPRRRLLVAGCDHLAEIGETLAHIRVAQSVHNSAIELADRFSRGALRNPQTMPKRDVHPRHAYLVSGWDFGQGGPA